MLVSFLLNHDWLNSSFHQIAGVFRNYILFLHVFIHFKQSHNRWHTECYIFKVWITWYPREYLVWYLGLFPVSNRDSNLLAGMPLTEKIWGREANSNMKIICFMILNHQITERKRLAVGTLLGTWIRNHVQKSMASRGWDEESASYLSRCLVK